MAQARMRMARRGGDFLPIPGHISEIIAASFTLTFLVASLKDLLE